MRTHSVLLESDHSKMAQASLASASAGADTWSWSTNCRKGKARSKLITGGMYMAYTNAVISHRFVIQLLSQRTDDLAGVAQKERDMGSCALCGSHCKASLHGVPAFMNAT